MLSIPLLGDASRVAAVRVESSSSSGEPQALCGLMADF